MTSPRTLLKAWELKAKKQWGQNFLSDPGVAETIVRRAGLTAEDTVMEIGAGLGSLTVPLAKSVLKVLAIEKDRRLQGLLQTELAVSGLRNVTIIDGDVLRMDLASLAAGSDDRWTVVGNLPYNISSQILVHLIGCRQYFRRAVLMFQKELADRLIAAPGGKDYGRITVMLQYCSRVSRLMEVNATSFYPKPKVDSTVLDIVFREPTALSEPEEKLFLDVIRAAFSKRRKTLKNALTRSTPSTLPGDIMGAFDAAGIDPTRRAETLAVADFIRLTRCLLESATGPRR